MMEHTKEPWSYPSDEGARRITNMETIIAWKRECGFTDADARRIVACVNACEGVPTEQLEWDKSMFIDMMKDADRYRAIRNGCGTSLYSILNTYEEEELDAEIDSAIEAAMGK